MRQVGVSKSLTTSARLGQAIGGVRGRIINAEGAPITAVFELSTGLVGAGNAAVVFNAATHQ